jgi:hyperosmotically inducible protein
VTADQQKENARDRELTQNIRRALMQDKTLSSYAHNVKVIAQGGQVTLKGPVRTEEEKRPSKPKRPRWQAPGM